MSESMKNNWKKWFRRDNLIVLVLAGILLFVIALPTKKSDESKSVFTGETQTNAYSDISDTEQMSYVAEQEKRLEQILSSVDGVGKVRVMLTCSASEELVVEKDRPINRSDTEEEDSLGGNRKTSQYAIENSTVYRTAGGESSPYVIKTLSPTIEGALVVAEGAGTGTINKNIVEIVQALYGVEAHKIKVVPLQR